MTDPLRLPPAQRKAIIVKAAYEVAVEFDLATVDFNIVAEYCSVSTSAATVRRYFYTRSDLQRAVCTHDRHFQKQGVRLGLF